MTLDPLLPGYADSLGPDSHQNLPPHQLAPQEGRRQDPVVTSPLLLGTRKQENHGSGHSKLATSSSVPAPSHAGQPHGEGLFCIRKGGRNVGRELSLTDGNESGVSTSLEAIKVLANSRSEEWAR